MSVHYTDQFFHLSELFFEKNTIRVNEKNED